MGALAAFLPPLLIAALADHFGTSSVVVLFKSGPDDEDLGFVAALPNMARSNIHTCSVIMKEDIIPEMRLNHSVILDHSGVYKALGGRQDLFDFNMYWIVPEGFLDPPPALRLDSNFYSVAKGDDGRVEIREWYRIRSSPPLSNALGHWSGQAGLTITASTMWERRKNLHGITLTTATLPFAFFVYPTGGGSFGGMVPEVYYLFRSFMNFTVDWVIPEDRFYGVPLGNGSWNGLIGMLARREADIIVAFLGVTLERSEVVSFSNTLLESVATLVIVDPSYVGEQRSDINLTAFLSVFSSAGWLVILTLLVVTFLACLVYALAMLGSSRLEGVLLSLTFSFKPFTRQDLSMGTGSLSSRMLLITVMGYSLVALSYYEGMLTSFMTSKSTSLEFNSFSDSLDLGYQVITVRGSLHETDLKVARPGSGRHKIYQRTMRDNPEVFYDSREACREAMLEDPTLAMVGSSMTFLRDERFMPLDNLDDAKIDHGAFAMQKDSEFLRLFNYHVVKLFHAGIIDFTVHKWLNLRRPDDVCGGKAPDTARPLGYENLSLPSMILAGGMIAALATSVIERSSKFKRLGDNNVKI